MAAAVVDVSPTIGYQSRDQVSDQHLHRRNQHHHHHRHHRYQMAFAAFNHNKYRV